MNGRLRMAGLTLAALSALAFGAGAAQAKTPARYTTATSEYVTGYAGWYTIGEVTCPAGTVPFSGGVVFDSFDLSMRIDDSVPLDDGWRVVVHNGLSDIPFQVYAVCAKRPKDYQVVESAWVQYGGYSQTSGFTPCPTGTKVLGGGAQVVASSSDVYLGQGGPSQTGGTWSVSVANETWGDVFQVYAVCGHATASYSVVNGSSVTVPAGTERLVNVYCPSGTKPLGGGVGFGWSLPDFGIHNTLPLLTGWSTTVNNTTDEDLLVNGSVACE